MKTGQKLLSRLRTPVAIGRNRKPFKPAAPQVEQRRFLVAVAAITAGGLALIFAAYEIAPRLGVAVGEVAAIFLMVGGLLAPWFLALPVSRACRVLEISTFGTAVRVLIAPLWVIALLAIPTRSVIPLAALVAWVGVISLIAKFRNQIRLNSGVLQLQAERSTTEDDSSATSPKWKMAWFLSDGGWGIVWGVALFAVLYISVLIAVLTALYYSPVPVHDTVLRPNWSSDGARIAYTQWRADRDCFGNGWTAVPDGTDRVPVGSYRWSAAPLWSPAEPRIGMYALTDTMGPVVWRTLRIAPNGSAVPISYDIRDTWRGVGVPRWAPDGTALAWVGLLTPDAIPALVVTEPDGKHPIWIDATDRRHPGIGAYGWSPDSTKLAYVALASPAEAGMWVISRDGSTRTRISTDTPRALDWSPDGRAIAYVSGSTTSPGIWVVAADGSNAQLLLGASDVEWITWSPSGNEIAYETRDGASRNSIHVAEVTGDASGSAASTGLAVLSPTAEVYSIDWVPTKPVWKVCRDEFPGIDRATWSPDGRRLLFSTRSLNSAIHVVNVPEMTDRSIIRSPLRWIPMGRLLPKPRWLEWAFTRGG